MRPTRIGVFATAALAAAIPAYAAQTAPHPPSSAAERALDAILKQSDRDDDLLDNLFKGRGAKTFKPKVDYSAMLTPALLAALRTKEATLVRTDCNGAYLEGELCGMDYSPLTCAQDAVPHYRYRTEVDDGSTARLIYFWPKETKATATFKLVKVSGRWRLDGVACEDGDPVNM